MAPKKKGGSKQANDWEAELGDSVDAAPEAATAEDVNGDAEAEMNGGGLLAALKKNKNKRAKKGKPVDDFVEGEDPPVEDPVVNNKPPEANLEQDDAFAGGSKKGKPGKKVAQQPAEEPADGDKDDEGGLKSKKEKEREKREREKQRKKEQVSNNG